jgi:translation initiation factor IF-1
MSSTDKFEVEGSVKKTFSNTVFKVKLDRGAKLRADISSKMRV